MAKEEKKPRTRTGETAPKPREKRTPAERPVKAPLPEPVEKQELQVLEQPEPVNQVPVEVELPEPLSTEPEKEELPENVDPVQPGSESADTGLKVGQAYLHKCSPVLSRHLSKFEVRLLSHSGYLVYTKAAYEKAYFVAKQLNKLHGFGDRVHVE